MSRSDHTPGSDIATAGDESESGLVDASTVAEYARRGLQSSVVTGIVGGAFLLQGVRSLRKGHRLRGLGGLLVGGLFTAMAVAQRGSDVDLGEAEVGPADVVDTGPDVEDVAGESTAADEDHVGGDEAAAVVDTAPDVEDVGSSPEVNGDASDSPVDQSDVVDTGTAGSAETDESSESAE